jgi:hypothetical protein
MRKLVQDRSWVVYQATGKGVTDGTHSVCGQSEWEAMERANPGGQTLIRGGITNEGEAERLARGVAGDTKPRGGLKAAS